jgi:hypothetical protein
VAVKERSLHGPTFDRPALRMRELGICHWVAHGAWRQQAALFAIARCCDLQRLIRRCSSQHQRHDLYRWFRNLARLPLPSPSCSSTVRTQHNAARFLRCIRLNSKENTVRLGAVVVGCLAVAAHHRAVRACGNEHSRCHPCHQKQFGP